MDPRASYKALLDRPVLPHDEDLQQTLYENEAQVPRTTLEELIREREGYVSAVDRAIRRLEAVVKRLSEQRVVAREELSLCRKATSSPIRRLPPELLLVIFQCHVDDRSIFAEDEFRLYSESKQCRSLPSFLASVLKITHICRAWRGLAHGSPHLWQQIFICDMQAYGQRAVSNTVEWMQRAAPLPVSYTVYGAIGLVDLWRERYKQDTGGRPFRIFDRDESLPTRRIRTLRLQLPAHDLDFLTSLSSSSIGKMFPVLEHLQIKVRHGELFQHGSLNMLAHSSFLRTLDLRQSEGLDSGALNHHRLPWNSLTDLVLNCLRGLVDDFYDILRGCTALVRAELHFGSRMDWPSWGERDIITLPHLRTLSIACCGNISSFRQSLCLPDLVSFKLSHSGDFDGDDFSVALTAILAHAPHVTELKLQNCNAENLDIFRFLRLLPAVESLELSSCTFALVQLYTALSAAGTQTLIPRLRQLSLLYLTDASESRTAEREEGLFAMVSTRQGRKISESWISQLQYFSYHAPWNPLSKAVRHKLLALASDYMQVNV